jgi:DNA-binding transcriptional LysR family regulator
MNPSMRQLRAFAEIARQGSFTGAARKLHLTQSATSALLRELERGLGLALMDRTTRNLSLTEAGKQFLLHAERILKDVQHAIAEAKGLRDKRQGRVTIAASPLVSVTLLPRIIAAFVKAFPGVSVELHDLLTDQILERVRSGAVDVGIGTFQRSTTEFELVTLFEDRLGLVIPIDSPLANRRVLRWQDLENQDLIALSSGSAFRSLTEATIASLRLRTRAPRFEVGYMGTAVALVEAGLGVSVLPERAATLIRSSAACFRKLRAPAVKRAATLVRRADRTLSPAAAAFVTFLSDKDISVSMQS